MWIRHLFSKIFYYLNELVYLQEKTYVKKVPISLFRKILTLDNLWKCYSIIINWCCMWKKSWEYVDHILLYCEIARTLWNNLFARVGLAWKMLKKVIDLLTSWRSIRWRLSNCKSVEVSPNLWWCIWRKKNAWRF